MRLSNPLPVAPRGCTGCKDRMLTGAAGVAWDYVMAGTPHLARNYNASNQWWAMRVADHAQTRA